MEVAIPSSPPAMDFDRPPPFMSAPSSPRRYANLCFSAPASPTRMSEFYRNLHDEFDGISLGADRNPSAIPFDWEETPGTPKSPPAARSEDEFAFDFNRDLENESLSADELFDGGKIRPLKPPPRSQLGQNDDKLSTRNPSPRSPIAHGRMIIKGAFSPKKKKDSDPMKDFDPFEAAVESMRNQGERGRDISSHRAMRSLSPYRVPERQLEEDELLKRKTINQSLHNSSKSSTSSLASSSSSSSSSSKRNRKWRLRDFLLFRSASEGDKDSLKYTSLFKKHEDLKNGSLRSGSGGSGSRRKGQPPVSAHELHYTANRAVSEDMKKKTFLPYKKNIFGFGTFARK